MEALILAAGKGSRLGKLNKETPKSLLVLDSGKTILETSISCMYNLGKEVYCYMWISSTFNRRRVLENHGNS